MNEQPTRSPRTRSSIAIVLGVLLIVGGIVIGLNGRNKKVANLPSYSPVYLVSPSPSTAPSIAVESEPTTSPEAKASSTGTVLSTTTAKPTIKKTAAKSESITLPAYVAQSSLPDYTPVVSLPDYQPQYSSPSPAPSSSPVQKQTASLNVPGVSYSVEITGEIKVIDVLNSARAGGLSFKTQSYSGLGELITEINGQAQGDNQFWTYTVNNVCVSKGISAQTVKNGDTIRFFLTTEAESPCA